MSAPRSLQEILRDRQKEIFVGRVDHINQFGQSLGFSPEDARRRFIFNVFGQGGIGKTTLLRRFRQIAEASGFLAAWTNEIEEDIPSVMSRFVDELDTDNSFRRFRERYRAYRQRRQELESDPEAPTGLAAVLGRTLAKTGVTLGRRVPVAGAILDFVDEDALQLQAAELTTFLAKKLTNKDEIRLLQSPIDELTPRFLGDLGNFAKGVKLAFFFDTYEKTQDHLDSWIRDLLDGRFGVLPANIVIAIGGREQLNPNYWSAFDGLVSHLPLEPFNEGEVRQYLAQKEVVDDQVIAAISKLSGRIPLLVATLASENPKSLTDIGDPGETAVERFLKWVREPVHRQLALNAAVPRRINQDIIDTIGPTTGGNEQSFAWLRTMPFVEERSDSWIYHEVVRAQLLRYKRRESPQGWIDLHGRMENHYISAKEKLGLSGDLALSDSDFQAFAIEEVYHGLCQAPQKTIMSALSGYLEALEHGRMFASRWAEAILQAGTDTEHEGTVEWGLRLLEPTRGFREINCQRAVEGLSAVLRLPEIEPRHRVIVLERRAKIHLLASHGTEALEDIEAALELHPKSFSLLGFRGFTKIMLGHMEEGREDLEESLRLEPDFAPSISSLAMLDLLNGDHVGAQAKMDKAADLESEYRVFSELIRKQSDLVTAFTDFKASAAVLSEPKSLAARLKALAKSEVEYSKDSGLSYAAEMVDYFQMLADILEGKLPENAETLLDRIKNDLPVQGLMNIDALWTQIGPLAKQYASAMARVTAEGDDASADEVAGAAERAMSLFSKFGSVDGMLLYYAELYRRAGRLEDALLVCNSFLLEQHNNPQVLRIRSAVFTDMGRYEEALSDLDIAHGDDGLLNRRVLNDRGLLYTYMGRFEEALLCFHSDLDKNPGDPSSVYNVAIATVRLRGLAGSRVEVERARDILLSLLDINRAMSLYGLGGLKAVEGEVDSALLFLGEAISLDPSVMSWAKRDVAWSDVRSKPEFLALFLGPEA